MLLSRVFDFIKFRFKSGNQHSIHSPFVFSLYTEVIRKNVHEELFIPIEEHRTELTLNNTKIDTEDFGAGNSKKSRKRISSIAKRSLKPPRQSRLLYRLINHFQPKTIIELGTSLGTTTSYLAQGIDESSNIITFEGSKSIADVALDQFKSNQINNIELVIGNIDETLPKRLQTLKEIDFVFFDANHRYEPTLRYFKECLNKSHEDSVFIFDDIYWSSEMKKAWQDIIKDESITISIDLYHIGLVFFRKKQPKQHFTLRF